MTPSFTPSSGITPVKDGVVNHRILARRNHRRRRAIDVGVQPHPRGVEPHLVPRRIAGDDAVEIVGIALRFDQRLAAAGRAGVEIRARRARVVVRGDDRLCGHGHLVNRSMSEVHELLGMTGDEIGVAADVARVGPRCRVSRFHRGRQRRIRNRPAQPAVAGRLQLAIPSGLRQPDFDADVGVAGWRQFQRHATERRQRLERRSGIRVGRCWRREARRLTRTQPTARDRSSLSTARATRTQSAPGRRHSDPSIAAANNAIQRRFSCVEV